MARPVKYSSREREKSRIWQCVLYPDSKSYDCEKVILSIKQRSVQYILIYHDCDFYMQSDYDEWMLKHDGKIPDWFIGDLKKPHYHCIFIFGNSIQLGLLSSIIGLTSNFIEKVENKVGAIQYLVHKNNPEKYQYSVEKIESNIINYKKKYFDLDNDMKALNIINEIERRYKNSEPISISIMASWCIKNGCWDEFRRGQHVFTAIIREFCV